MFVIADRVKETSTSTGLGDISLAGAMTGFSAFSARCAVGDTLYYAIQAVDVTGQPTGEWECGLGTYSAANTLTRTTVTSSSNADAAVTFSAGTKHVYITMPAVQAKWIKEKLTADRTYYVRTDGNNSNTGLANTSGGAFLTIQKAVDVVSKTLLLAGFTVTIQVADGTYTSSTTLYPLADTGTVIIQGNSTTPSNVVVSVTSATCFVASGANANYTVKDMKLQTTTAGNGLYSASGAILVFSNLVFGAIATIGLLATNRGYIGCGTGYSIVGGGSRHISAAFGGQVNVSGAFTVTITGTPAFSISFCEAIGGGIVYFATLTFSGATTGLMYSINMNGMLYLNGKTLPGASSSQATGAQVLA